MRLKKLRLKFAIEFLALLGSALFIALILGACSTSEDPLIGGQLGGTSGARLTSWATSLAWTQGGDNILFASGGLLGIYVVDSGGRQLRAFPETAPQIGDWEQPGAFSPSLSPDGLWVAYSVFVPTENSVIEVAGINGKDVRRLTAPPESYRDEDGRIRDTRNEYDIFPVWSPDGQQIAFISNRRPGRSHFDGFRIFVMSVDGSDIRMLAPVSGS